VSADGDHQASRSYYGGAALPATPVTRGSRTILVFGVIAATLALASVSFVAGRLTAPKVSVADRSATQPELALDPVAADESDSAGITVVDANTDSVPHPVDGETYGPSEIVQQSIRSSGGLLVITMEFSSSTPMDLISTGFRIRLDPDAIPSCKDSVLDSWDWSVDYDTGGIEISEPGADCDDDFRPTSLTGSSDITGSTLTIKLDEDALGLRPGQRVVVRSCASTRIDADHTTFIQDWAPDSPSGAVGEL
jgi:hypothetical protein